MGGRPNIYPSQRNVVAPEVSSLLLLVSHPVVLPPRPIAWNSSNDNQPMTQVMKKQLIVTQPMDPEIKVYPP